MIETEKLVPRRRFREFINNGAWEQRKLGEVVNVRSGKDYKHLQEGSIPVYGTGGYMLSVNEALSYLEDAIGIGRKGTIDKPYILKAPFWTVDTLFYAFPRETNDLNFVFDIFQNIDWKKKDESTGVPSLSKTSINEIDVLVPKTDEQRSIGAYFAKIDNLITLHQRKVKKIKALKSAYLSEMFPAEGECRPKRRFAGFTEDWEQRKLLDFGKSTGGTSIESEFSEDGIYKVISIGSYSENSIYTDQGLRAVDSDKTRKRILNEGDLTMILNDKTSSGNIIGRVLLIEKSGVYVYNQRTERIEINSEKYDSLFLYEMLNAPQIREKIIKQSQGNTQIYVNWPIIEQTEYLIPKLEEQKHIGTYFKHLDHLITLHQRKLEKLQNIKKAFLNEMFI